MGMIGIVPITKTELTDIQQVMITLVNSFPELPSQVKKDGILFEQLKPKKVCMCMSTMANPYKITTYIDGSYISRYRFRLILQTMDIKDEDRIDSQGILSKIGEWFEGRTIVKSDGTTYEMGSYPTMQDRRRITKMYKNSVPKLVQRLPSNIELTEAIYTVEYYVQTDF